MKHPIVWALSLGSLVGGLRWSVAEASPVTDFHRVIEGDYYELSDHLGVVKTGSFEFDFYYSTNPANLQRIPNPAYPNQVTYKPFSLYQDKYYAHMTFLLGANSQMPNARQTVTDVAIEELIVIDDGPNDYFIIWGSRHVESTVFSFEARFEAPPETLSSTDVAPLLAGEADAIYTSPYAFVFASPVGYPSDTGWRGWGGNPTSVGPMISVIPAPHTLSLVLLALAVAALLSPPGGSGIVKRRGRW